MRSRVVKSRPLRRSGSGAASSTSADARSAEVRLREEAVADGPGPCAVCASLVVAVEEEEHDDEERLACSDSSMPSLVSDDALSDGSMPSLATDSEAGSAAGRGRGRDSPAPRASGEGGSELADDELCSDFDPYEDEDEAEDYDDEEEDEYDEYDAYYEDERAMTEDLFPSVMSAEFREALMLFGQMSLGNANGDENELLESRGVDLQLLDEVIPAVSASRVDDKGDECIICKDEFAPDGQVRVLPCSHVFHKGCIDLWLSTHATCPTCRHDLAFLQSERPDPENEYDTDQLTDLPPLEPDSGTSESEVGPEGRYHGEGEVYHVNVDRGTSEPRGAWEWPHPGEDQGYEYDVD